MDSVIRDKVKEKMELYQETALHNKVYGHISLESSGLCCVFSVARQLNYL